MRIDLFCGHLETANSCRARS